MIYCTYSLALPYPQDALFGRGVIDDEGVHTPPAGMDSYLVDELLLTEGIDERFYETTGVATVSLRSQAEIDAVREADALPIAKADKQVNLDAGYEAAEEVPVNISGIDFGASADALAELNSVVIYVIDGNSLPPAFSWVDVDGIERPATEAQIKSLQFEVAKKHYADAHKYARLTNQVKAATTVAEVEAIPDW